MLVKIFSFPIHAYRMIISPLIGKNCRFEPTCSTYALESLKIHGVIKGSLLTMIRLLKCHPFSKSSGYDPVPEKNNIK
jgi:hypothetical protein